MNIAKVNRLIKKYIIYLICTLFSKKLLFKSKEFIAIIMLLLFLKTNVHITPYLYLLHENLAIINHQHFTSKTRFLIYVALNIKKKHIIFIKS